jgi:hypothetical protein
VTAYIASGIDQASIISIRPLALADSPGSSTAGWLNRMTQFKEKAGKNTRR